jgi:hypothetical protein
MKRLNLISSPRNLSTALMYSFAQRKDTQVIDEPFYAHYLSCTDINHPGKEEIMQSMNHNADEIIREVFFGDYSSDILFVKNMTSHIVEMEEDFLNNLTNIFYIRNPKQIIASYAKVVDNPSASELGTARQFELFLQLKKSGNNPVVFDSGELLKDPEMAIRKLCDACDIPYNKNMLSWKAGGRPEDGVWAKYWYENVHLSTGFKKQKTSLRDLPEKLDVLYQNLKPFYEKMYNYCIKV